LLALLCVGASGHDLITPESAARFLSESARLHAVISSSAPVAKRARAAYDLGAMLDEIRELLNRDLAAHGEVQGLASNYLIAELQRRNTPLAHSPARKRYLSNTSYFAQSLRLSPQSDFAVDAAFRLLQGTFYDGFDADPLQSDESWEALRAQIGLGEGLALKRLAGERREEAEFILAVRYVRAAKRAPEATLTRGYAEKARTALAGFEQRYPESLRAAAIPVLRDALPQ